MGKTVFDSRHTGTKYILTYWTNNFAISVPESVQAQAMSQGADFMR